MGLPTRSEIERWNDAINDLSSAATSYRTAAERVESAADAHMQQLSAPGGTDWEGDAADAARESGYADRGVVCRAADHMRDMAKTANLGAQNLSQIRDNALEAISEAEVDGFQVGNDLSVTDTHRYTSGEASLFEARKAKAEVHHGYIAMRAGALASADAEIGARLQGGATALDSMIPQQWNKNGETVPANTVGDGTSGDEDRIVAVDYTGDNPPDTTAPPIKTVLSGPPPPGKVEGTGVWTVDQSRPQSSPAVPTGPQPGEGQVVPFEPDPTKEGAWTGPMSAGPSSPATGFDYQHNYRFRIAGTQQTNVVQMVQIGDSWYPATWNQYLYEVQDQNRVVGIGDLGAISEIPAPGPWQPITLPEIGALSHKFPNNTFYIPDGCGGAIPMVDTVYSSMSPPVPTMRRGD
ncbi:WXG100 family type VII secretion target [Mycolicibacterium litorale]|uniref:WXG100 family type VII secretion target n=1 Tax=Mycolicibacterium litorale TaxID=758802 RepID=UPI0016236EAF|nr:hypothetical protein [Mycolicibacterium litorale]